MKGIREFIGEIEGEKVIKVGDRVKIEMVDGTEQIGILREATRTKIKINGAVELREIDVNRISKIEKIT